MKQHTIHEGNRYTVEGQPTWRKACRCINYFGAPDVTATTGRILTTQHEVDGMIHLTATLHPEPVCDVCDTPWVQ